MKILKYKEHAELLLKSSELVTSLLNAEFIKEENLFSDDKAIIYFKKISETLNFNYNIVTFLKDSIHLLYPVIEKLIDNNNFNIEKSFENILLLTLAATCVSYLESVGNPTGNATVSKDDIRTILEELKLKGIGNGIVRKITKCLKSITDIIKDVFKNTSQFKINGFYDIVSNSKAFNKIIAAVLMFVIKHKIDIDSLPNSFATMGMVISKELAKKGMDYFSNSKLFKNKKNINYEQKH